MIKRRKTRTVKVGNISIGSKHPIVVQSMTNTETADVQATFKQTVELIEAGSELVRWTINHEKAAQASVKIIKELRKKGYQTPIVGDFHYNGHILLNQFPECACLLDKYRINPGNVGKGKNHDRNFEKFIHLAIRYNKPLRIGVNSGSLDQELLASLQKKNIKQKHPKSYREIVNQAMVESALQSAQYARKCGLKENKLILSVKSSDVQDLISLNQRLAQKCDDPIHLGLTEAGSGREGSIKSTAALAILLQQGIGDTIRISLTPSTQTKRSFEVEVCQTLLQSLQLRFFSPEVISCPGCGRTDTQHFEKLLSATKEYIKKQTPQWKKQRRNIAKKKIAVMGCVVNGPGESKAADIGISLPGKTEKPVALVYRNGRKITTLNGKHILKEFLKTLEETL